MRTAPALAIVLVLLLSPDAFAATASVRAYSQYATTTAMGLFYTAAPGERNRVVATADHATAYFYDIILRDAGAVVTPGPGCSAIDEHAVRCASAPSVLPQSSRPSLSMIVDVADGDDTVAMPATWLAPTFVQGGGGNDDLSGAGALFGGAGNDVLTGGDDSSGYKGSGPPSDVLAGGLGDDILRARGGDDLLSGDGDVQSAAALPGSVGPDRGGGNDVIEAGPGEYDRVLYDGRTTGVRVDLADTRGFHGGPGERDRLSGVETVIGGGGDDVLFGNEEGNRLEGGAGDDEITGRGGWDILAGGAGTDVLDGGDGRDRLDGATGRDTLRGGDGNDDLTAAGPGAVLDGGSGSDHLSSSHPRALRCGRGRDIVYKPRSLLLTGCESVQVGRYFPAYYDTATVSVQPRRLRGGGVGVAWSCEATANRCDLRVTVRAGSTLLGRRSAVLFKRDAKGEIVVGRRRALRRGQLLEVSISGAIYESDYRDGRTQRFTASWNTPL